MKNNFDFFFDDNHDQENDLDSFQAKKEKIIKKNKVSYYESTEETKNRKPKKYDNYKKYQRDI